MKVLLLARYGHLGSSSRLRFYQYLPYLAENGLDVTVAPFFDDEYVRRLYSGQRQSPSLVAGAYRRRLRTLLGMKRYDLVWLEKEVLPWLPDPPLIPPYLVDYDDATFHRYDRHHSPLVRLLLGRKIDTVMRRARLVIAGNAYLAARARSAGARRVEILPTVVDTARYPPPADHPENPFTIGWIGAPVTVDYLHLVEPTLMRFMEANPAARLAIVGAQAPFSLSGRVEVRPWSEAGEAEELARFDVGIMPLPDEPFERGKCGYKLIQYMASGLPVIASPVGVNIEIVEPEVNGFLADSQDDWLQALERLRADRGLRRRLGAAGREKVKREFSLDVNAPKLLALLKAAAA